MATLPRHLNKAYWLVPFVLSACTTVGPEYTSPEADVQTNWVTAEETQLQTTSVNYKDWWQEALQDQELTKLVNAALDQNYSLRAAGLRIIQSQQQLAIATDDLGPQDVPIGGSAARSRANKDTSNNYDLGFNLNWELDFWGRFSLQVDAAAAELEASVANYDDAVVLLVAQVCQNYTLVRTFQQRIKVAGDNIQLQTESLRIAEAKFDAGEVSELDIDQAESLLNNTRATRSALEISLHQTKNSLASLIGKSPAELNYLIATDAPIPVGKADIAIGMPQDLIRQRPDIRASERGLAAQSARVGFAVSELYPHLSIGGSIGTSSSSTSDMFNSSSERWSIFGMFEWDILNYTQLQGNIRLQDAVFQEQLEDYRNTVLQAQVEVENAIVAYLKSHEQLRAYERAAAASGRAVAIAKTQYTNGLVDFDTVISTLGSHTRQQDFLASTRGNVTNGLIEVYRSLGGGWEIREDAELMQLIPEQTWQEMLERNDVWEKLDKEEAPK